jgi:hypothetical protein
MFLDRRPAGVRHLQAARNARDLLRVVDVDKVGFQIIRGRHKIGGKIKQALARFPNAGIVCPELGDLCHPTHLRIWGWLASQMLPKAKKLGSKSPETSS